MTGKWIEAPGYNFFDTVYKRISNANIIAEDLGDLRQEVFELRGHYNLKGMIKSSHFILILKQLDLLMTLILLPTQVFIIITP